MKLKSLLSVLFFAAAGLGFAADPGYEASCPNLAPGSDATQVNFAWLTKVPGKPAVEITRAGAKPQVFTGTQVPVTATQYNGDDKSLPTGTWSDKVTVTGLTDKTTYTYRIGDGKTWGPEQTLTTRDQKHFGFFVVGDPQVGARSTGPKTLDNDRAGWTDTVSKATAKYPQASFMVSLGDEVNDYNKRETQDAEYQAFFSPAQFQGLPLATVNGNHDFQMGEYYGFHYNQPNQSASYGVSYGNDGDYWFTYGNALFLMLNSNTESAATHDQFLRDTIAKNSQARWRIVCFHHSIYSEAEHVTDPDVADRRSNYGPVFDRYHIDLALQGHDHSYTRTFPIRGGKPLTDEVPAADGTLTDPAGTVYLTFNSGSGSKFYDWKDAAAEVFSAARWQGKVPSFGYLDVAGDRITLTEYRTDDQSVIDTFSVVKTK